MNIPFLFLHKYALGLTNFPEEPVLSLSPELDKDANEKQDLATILHHLWRESIINQRPEVDLAEFIPGLKKETYVVKPPKRFAIQKLRNKVNDVNTLEQLFNEKHKRFAKEGQAFINAEKASWGDTFVFLKKAKEEKWVVLILQSKRRASKKEQVRTQLLKKDLDKVLGADYSAFDRSKFSFLYLFITDCSTVEACKLPEHVCVITRNEHMRFYGRHRQKLRDLRDLPAYTRPKKTKKTSTIDLTDAELDDPSQLTVVVLKSELEKRGLALKVERLETNNAKGNKADLVERLRGAIQAEVSGNPKPNLLETKQ